MPLLYTPILLSIVLLVSGYVAFKGSNKNVILQFIHCDTNNKIVGILFLHLANNNNANRISRNILYFLNSIFANKLRKSGSIIISYYRFCHNCYNFSRIWNSHFIMWYTKTMISSIQYQLSPIMIYHQYISALHLLKDVSILVRVILTRFPGTAVKRFNYYE